jgi:predicted nicotinamide N-methyase
MIANPDSFDDFWVQATRLQRPSLVPEVQLRLAGDLTELWSARDEWRGRLGGTAPYWGVAWPGGLALSRLVLDRPELVRGKRVLDVGAGSGVCAIAAALAGAHAVVAADIDPDACEAICRNAALNSVTVAVSCADPIGSNQPVEVVLAADLWYERFFARRATAWLHQMASAGLAVYMADPGRSYAPRAGIVELASYQVSPSSSLERADTIPVRAFRFLR